jgi:hypothetical protein
MTATRTIPISVTVSMLIGSVALFFALPEFSHGNERYETSAILFPYAFLIFHLAPFHALLLPLMFAQFPAYGLFFAWAWRKKRNDWAAAWLFMTHVGLAASALWLRRIDFAVSHGSYQF